MIATEQAVEEKRIDAVDRVVDGIGGEGDRAGEGAVGIPLYDAFESLHPSGAAPRAYFADECHPNADGHEALAAGLCEFLAQSHLVRPAQK